ncbi:hypothetical protein BH23ACT9_BH23ACT9_11340 [soil metagenome]
MNRSHVLSAAAGAGLALLADRAVRSGPAKVAALSGSTLASPTAAAWITDFLNAVYFAKDPTQRDLRDLRLAFTILTTFWDREGARTLGATDVLRFHRAFGTARLRGVGGRTGLLDRQSLLRGATTLLGDWFPEASVDWDRLGWGIAFPTREEKAAHDPEVRLARAKVGSLTPPVEVLTDQIWHTYPPVEVPDAAATAQAVLAVEHWPDYASELGRFTPLRRGGLDGQTFEIEVVGFPSPRTPVFMRAYVTVTTLVTSEDQAALETWVADLRSRYDMRPHELTPIPDGAEVHAALDLTCHEGHFMGHAMTRLVLYRLGGRSYLRAAGTWDPMQHPMAELYERTGQDSQRAFWGMASPRESMLHQIAERVAARLPAHTGA